MRSLDFVAVTLVLITSQFGRCVGDSHTNCGLVELLYMSHDPRVYLIFARAHNRLQPINWLPPHLLARIFTVGADESRRFRPRVAWYSAFQDRVSHVCSHWRYVAILTPALWAYIDVTRPPPHKLASLYIMRTGPTSLLDINIEMRTRYLDRLSVCVHAWRDQVTQISKVFEFLVALGARMHRWRSLAICAKRPEPLFKAIGMINAHAAPALRFLRLRWKIGRFTGLNEEIESEECIRALHQSRFFSSLSPSLHSVDLISVPWYFVLTQPSLFRGLTKLSLTAACSVRLFSGFGNLLLSNPRLETLSIASGFAKPADWDFDFKPAIVRMTSLRWLAISTSTHINWVLCVTQSIDAPLLQKLALSSRSECDPKMADLVRYIATGNASSDNFAIGNSDLATKPIYPSLRELDISEFRITYYNLKYLLSALPSVSRIAMSADQAEVLGEEPWVLPNLAYLDFPGVPYSLLGNLLQLREEAGVPIKAVDLLLNCWEDEVVDELPATVDLEEHWQPDPEQDWDDSDPEDSRKVNVITL